MISEKIKEEIKAQGKRQSDIIIEVNKIVKEKSLVGMNKKPLYLNQSQLSNFLNKKSLLNIAVVEIILDILGISLIKIL